MKKREDNIKINTGIADFLDSHAEEMPVSFHMPGHKGRRIFDETGIWKGANLSADWDITEIPGADNLFQPEGIIAQAMEKYRILYRARKSYLLINGSSAGILAAILSSVSRGGKVIRARNCHKSAFNAIRLGGIVPVYIYPKTDNDFGIQAEVDPYDVEEALKKHPEAAAVMITRPNYYGICSDIKTIADKVHRYGKILIVDQAHGAHLKFFGEIKAGKLKFPQAAEDSSADIIINSTHKTLASFTQTAVLNVCGEKTDLRVLEDKLQMLESSSPSYPLMASLDFNAELLIKKGTILMERWAENLEYFYDRVMSLPRIRLLMHPGLDPTKINIDMSEAGLDGLDLEKYLMKKGIFTELATGNILMCMSGIGNIREDYERLAAALEEAAAENENKKAAKSADNAVFAIRHRQTSLPENREDIFLDDAVGRVCALPVIPYPPGIPVLCPGEVIDRDTVMYIKKLRGLGEKVIGVSDRMEISVGKE